MNFCRTLVVAVISGLVLAPVSALAQMGPARGMGPETPGGMGPMMQQMQGMMQQMAQMMRRGQMSPEQIKRMGELVGQMGGMVGAMHGVMGSMGQPRDHQRMKEQMSRTMQQMAEMHKRMAGVMNAEKAALGETQWCGGKFIPGKGTNFAACQ